MESPVLAAGGKDWRVDVTLSKDRKTLFCCVYCTAKPPPTAPLWCHLSILNQKGKPNLEVGTFFQSTGSWNGEYNNGIVCRETIPLNSNQLSNPDLGVCVDDKIIVKVDLEFDLESKQRMPTLYGWSLGDEFRNLLFQPTLSDASIVVETPLEASAVNHVTIPAHCLILSMSSPVFREMLHSGMQESAAKTIHITDFDEGTVRNFLTFLYTGRCSMHDDSSSSGLDQARKLLQFAHKYDVRPLLADCETCLELTWLTVDTVLDVLRLAEAYNAARLKMAALQFIADNSRSLMSNAAFLDMVVKECNIEVIRAIGGAIDA